MWLAVVMVVAKAGHWGCPADPEAAPATTAATLVSAHADLLFCVVIGLAGQLLPVARAEAAHAAFVASGSMAVFCLACVVYAVASVQIFAYLRSPLTYPLLYLAGDMGAMRSSLGSS